MDKNDNATKEEKSKLKKVEGETSTSAEISPANPVSSFTQKNIMEGDQNEYNNDNDKNKLLSQPNLSSKEESVSVKAKETGKSIKDVIMSLGNKTKTLTEETTREIKNKSIQTENDIVKKDAQDIQTLGVNIDKAISIFEDTMTNIEKEQREDHEKLLKGYKKLVEEQINVINATLNMAKRLKSSS